MKIAVVDDEKLFQMQLQMMVQKLAEKKELPFTVDAFSGGKEFIESLSSTRYDIVFMDIFMPEMDGIATATKLRELTERTFLIFLTASEGHYPEAFSLHAFDYVTKPFSIERIEQVLDEIVEHTPMDESFIKVSVGTQERKIYRRDIVSATTDGHYLEIHVTSGEEHRVRMTVSEFLEQVENDARYNVINRGIVVNMDRIEKLGTAEVIMDDGTYFPVTAKKASSIIQFIHDYKFRTGK